MAVDQDHAEDAQRLSRDETPREIIEEWLSAYVSGVDWRWVGFVRRVSGGREEAGLYTGGWFGAKNTSERRI